MISVLQRSVHYLTVYKLLAILLTNEFSVISTFEFDHEPKINVNHKLPHTIKTAGGRKPEAGPGSGTPNAGRLSSGSGPSNTSTSSRRLTLVTFFCFHN